MSLQSMALGTYDLLWRAATPLLRHHSRLHDGFGQRTLENDLPARADIWIQGASGGESYLTWELVRELKNPFSSRPLNVLATTNTRQGMEIIERAARETHDNKKGVTLQPRYFPFDAPRIMQTALRHVRPKVVVILETEIWPGFLHACRQQGAKVLLANGRMNPRSLAGYLAARKPLRALAPDRILAVSERDAKRFATLFGKDRVQTMANMKFDRMRAPAGNPRSDNPLREIIAPNARFVVLGSVREQEESEIGRLTARLHRKAPDAVLGLFPRHMERIDAWKERLDQHGIPWKLRSKQTGPAEPGTTLLWDTFGELVPAYALAKAAFVGGSLAPLGGQNFLEPLTCGITPVTGPSLHNFAWVGTEIFESGLAIRADDAHGVCQALLRLLDNPPRPADVKKAVHAYIRSRRGGTKTVSKHIAQFMNND